MSSEIEKIKKTVTNKIPGATLKKDDRGNLYVEYRGINLSAEYLLPETKDELTAWEYAELAVKTTQNFNRTHPRRLEGYSILETKERASKRGRRRSDMKRTIPYFGNEEDDGWI